MHENYKYSNSQSDAYEELRPVPTSDWDKLRELREQFVMGKEIDPQLWKSTYISTKMLNSWKEARKRGFALHGKSDLLEKKLAPSHFNSILEKNDQFIKLASRVLQRWANSYLNGVKVLLTDRKGIILLHKIYNPGLADLPEDISLKGTEMSEDNCGPNANAHLLSMNLKQPVYLYNFEHFTRECDNNVAFSGPINLRDGSIIGALVLVFPIDTNIKTPSAFYVNRRMGLLKIMLETIETEYNLTNEINACQRNSESHRKVLSHEHESSSLQEDSKITFKSIKGISPEIHNAIRMAKAFAKTPDNVLICGESGVGKELFARSIHNYYCPKGPFVAINCAAMPDQLLESELFGYEGGSFTGAERKGRPGKIELAHNGTLFLDEIGAMPLRSQTVFLRVLEEKRIMRIGGQHYKDVNFRLVAATNQDLPAAIKAKEFRQDLYYRLSVLLIEIPPLRERTNDIKYLCDHFIDTYCSTHQRNPVMLSDEALEIMNSYRWDGNVRELKNAMIYAINICEGDTIRPQHLPPAIRQAAGLASSPQNKLHITKIAPLKDWEKSIIEATLNYTNHRILPAAELLGIGKTTLYRKIKEYNLEANIDEDL